MPASNESVRIERLTGDASAPVLSALSALRIAVFRDWPYLYDGLLAYEQEYIAEFAACADSVIVAASAGDRIVGAATAAPLAGHSPQFVPLFGERGIEPDRVFYFGESVLLPEWRGAGFGHAFFDHREAHARACRNAAGQPYTHAAFCSVVRAADDPRAPAGYRPLDAFWMKRGFRPVAGLVGSYDWQEIGGTAEIAHPMQFWMRELASP